MAYFYELLKLVYKTANWPCSTKTWFNIIANSMEKIDYKIYKMYYYVLFSDGTTVGDLH